MATDEATAPLLVGPTVGENVRRLRGTLTQAELARRAQGVGLSWTRSHIAALEAGNRESIDLSTLVLLAAALDVPVPDLLDGEGEVRLTAEAVSSREGLRLALAGQRRPGLRLEGAAAAMQSKAQRGVKLVPYGPVDPATGLARWYDLMPAEVDAELADRLGVPQERVMAAAERLWGSTVHQERDRQLEQMPADMSAGERRARRGHITRALAKEIEAAIAQEREGLDQ